MRTKPKPFWQLEMTAENMLEFHDCYNTPYNGIDFMIDSCNIDLIPLNVKNTKLMGMLGDDKCGHRFIAYNKNMIPERVLFTKAHELGHFVLEHELKNDILIDNKDEPRNVQETEANVFAAALLMPKLIVSKIVNQTISELQIPLDDKGKFDFDKLGRKERDYLVSVMKMGFHTSKEAIEWRIKVLFGKK